MQKALTSKMKKVGWVGEKKKLSKETNKEKNVELNKISILPELPEFDPMKNVNELHRSYVTLPHKMQQGTISPLTLFHLFFTDYYFQIIANNTNSYEKLNQIDNGSVTMLTTIHKIIVCQVFGNMSQKALPILQVIDDYNYYIEGVDLADQL
ncbi:13268_t:CDS:2 [Cetraspora pellucida]|uniref:13268_t:CDS:1 n=1 Tax=Cetraspora pellucida TaxID=1433469 RepID=A0ACA9KAU2_9GLOM|nr:13268_t:CDS:2 [Cetraspora pellucida]